MKNNQPPIDKRRLSAICFQLINILVSMAHLSPITANTLRKQASHEPNQALKEIVSEYKRLRVNYQPMYYKPQNQERTKQNGNYD